MVEIAGTMSGGGGRPQQGRMGSQVRVDTTKDTGKEMAAAEKKLEQDQSRLEQYRTELHQVRFDGHH